jgi:hypothetical protein
MSYQFNIGLYVNGCGTPEEVAAREMYAHERLFLTFGNHFDSRYLPAGESGSEPTLVVRLTDWVSDQALPIVGFVEDLANSMNQDCIAVAVVNDKGSILSGKLVGPAAHKWGSFNPEFFTTYEKAPERSQVT